MKIWVDAQLSPLIAQWLRSTHDVEAVAVRDLRLRDARDRDIFLSAREAKAILTLILQSDGLTGTLVRSQILTGTGSSPECQKRYPPP